MWAARGGKPALPKKGERRAQATGRGSPNVRLIGEFTSPPQRHLAPPPDNSGAWLAPAGAVVGLPDATASALVTAGGATLARLQLVSSLWTPDRLRLGIRIACSKASPLSGSKSTKFGVSSPPSKRTSGARSARKLTLAMLGFGLPRMPIPSSSLAGTLERETAMRRWNSLTIWLRASLTAFRLRRTVTRHTCMRWMRLSAARSISAQLIKPYGAAPESAKGRYSPAECTGIIKTRVIGDPDMKHVSTSYAERNNLNIRMHSRRMTRLTNAFSKKMENHAHAMALHFLYYNFVRIHKALEVTPWMGRRDNGSSWEVADMVGVLEAWEATQ